MTWQSRAELALYLLVLCSVCRFVFESRHNRVYQATKLEPIVKLPTEGVTWTFGGGHWLNNHKSFSSSGYTSSKQRFSSFSQDGDTHHGREQWHSNSSDCQGSSQFPSCLPWALSGQNPNRFISSSSKSCGNNSFSILSLITCRQMNFRKFVSPKCASAFGHHINGRTALLKSGESVLVSVLTNCPVRSDQRVPSHHHQRHFLMFSRAKYSKINYCGAFPRWNFTVTSPQLMAESIFDIRLGASWIDDWIIEILL